MNSNINSISILGCGWYGLQLAKALKAGGYLVKGSSTSPEKSDLLKAHQILPYVVNFQESDAQYDPDFFNTDLLIICIPPKRSTGEQDSFTEKIRQIADAANLYQVKSIIFISSTAVYGDTNSKVTETDLPLPSTPSGLAMLAAEQLLQKNTAFTCTILRFSGLVGPGRDPGRFFAGKTDIPNGLAPINLIHLQDCIGITKAIIAQQAFNEIFNACCPDHLAKQFFYTRAAQRSNLIIPVFIDELKTWKIISDEKVSSVLNYKYLVTKWTDWLDQDKL